MTDAKLIELLTLIAEMERLATRRDIHEHRRAFFAAVRIALDELDDRRLRRAS